MRKLASLALGAGLLALSAVAMAEPAAARGSFGVYIGPGGYGPGYGGYYGRSYGPAYGYDYRDYCRDRRYRYYHRYECDRYYGYDDSYYDDPYYGGGFPGFFFFDSFGHRRFRHFDHDRHFDHGGHFGGEGSHTGSHHHH